MKKQYYEFPDAVEAYMGSVASFIPEYSPVRIAHAVVTELGRVLRMSGWPAIEQDRHRWRGGHGSANDRGAHARAALRGRRRRDLG